ncbi:hypothetical protein EIP86_003416 [Pleurotus ostreatoroseus]|nr:hypothetical protein EIP86_003416 [Pleurotus ostreatoroseus]
MPPKRAAEPANTQPKRLRVDSGSPTPPSRTMSPSGRTTEIEQSGENLDQRNDSSTGPVVPAATNSPSEPTPSVRGLRVPLGDPGSTPQPIPVLDATFRSFWTPALAGRINTLLSYQNNAHTCYAVARLPALDACWGPTLGGADNLDNYVCVDGKKLTVYLVGEIEAAFLYDQSGQTNASIAIMVKPLLASDNVILHRFLTIIPFDRGWDARYTKIADRTHLPGREFKQNDCVLIEAYLNRYRVTDDPRPASSGSSENPSSSSTKHSSNYSPKKAGWNKWVTKVELQSVTMLRDAPPPPPSNALDDLNF